MWGNCSKLVEGWDRWWGPGQRLTPGPLIAFYFLLIVLMRGDTMEILFLVTGLIIVGGVAYLVSKACKPWDFDEAMTKFEEEHEWKPRMFDFGEWVSKKDGPDPDEIKLRRWIGLAAT